MNHPYNTAALAAAFPQFQGAKVAFKPIRDNVKNFFNTGLIRTTSVGVSSAGGNGSSFNANYTYMDDEGFTPGNRLIKNTFGLGGTAKLSNKMTVNGTFNYAITDFKAPPTATGFGSNPSACLLYTSPSPRDRQKSRMPSSA